MTDPFAPEAPSDPWQEESNPSVQNTPQVAQPVVEVTNEELGITLKGGQGFDAPWITPRFGTVDAALVFFGVNIPDHATQADKVRALFKVVAQAARDFHGAVGGSKPSNGGGQQRQQTQQSGGQPGRPADADRPANVAPKYCTHGEMTYKTGVIKSGKNAGKTWQAFDCADGQCDREWVNSR